MIQTEDTKVYSKLIGESFDGKNTQVANFRLERKLIDFNERKEVINFLF